MTEVTLEMRDRESPFVDELDIRGKLSDFVDQLGIGGYSFFFNACENGAVDYLSSNDWSSAELFNLSRIMQRKAEEVLECENMVFLNKVAVSSLEPDEWELVDQAKAAWRNDINLINESLTDSEYAVLDAVIFLSNKHGFLRVPVSRIAKEAKVSNSMATSRLSSLVKKKWLEKYDTGFNFGHIRHVTVYELSGVEHWLTEMADLSP